MAIQPAAPVLFIPVIGSGCVGKSSYIFRASRDIFPEDFDCTIGASPSGCRNARPNKHPTFADQPPEATYRVTLLVHGRTVEIDLFEASS